MSAHAAPSFTAGGTINVGTCVKLDSSADNQILQATASTDNLIGIAKRSAYDTPGLGGADVNIAARAGKQCRIYGVGEVAPARAGAAIVRGVWLTSGADGRVITAPAAQNVSLIGQALESASGPGAEINVYVMPNRAGQF